MQAIETDQELATVLEKGNLVCLVFKGDWCGDCRLIDPFFPEWEKTYEGKIAFFLIDMKAAKAVYDAFRVAGIPSFVALRGKREVARLAGPQRKTKDQVDTFLEKVLAKDPSAAMSSSA